MTAILKGEGQSVYFASTRLTTSSACDKNILTISVNAPTDEPRDTNHADMKGHSLKP